MFEVKKEYGKQRPLFEPVSTLSISHGHL